MTKVIASIKTKYKYLLLSTALITHNVWASFQDDITNVTSNAVSVVATTGNANIPTIPTAASDDSTNVIIRTTEAVETIGFAEGQEIVVDSDAEGAINAAANGAGSGFVNATAMLKGIEDVADFTNIGTATSQGSVSNTTEGGTSSIGAAFKHPNFTTYSPLNQLASIDQLTPANQLRYKRIAHRINKLRKLLPEGHAPGAEMTQHSHRLANQIITNRIGTIGMALVTGEGVAAGDNNIITNPGIWLNAIGGKAIQGSPNGRIPGYKMTTTGFTLGGDALFNNNWLGGAAVTYSNAITKYTARKAGNKSTGKSLIFTLYGSYSGWENWVINATASYGNTRTVNKSIRQVFGTLTQTASAKYNANMYALNTNVAYTYHIANINTAIIPNVGLQYSSFDQAGYKETGTTAQNLTFAKMKGIAQGIVAPGLTFRKENLVFGNVQIIPEILGYVNYSFYKKSPSVRATTFANVTMVNSTPVLASMMQKRDYNFGCNLTAKTKQLEFTIGALATVVKKYKAYQGTLKLRVNL